MSIHFADIACIDLSVAVYIRASKFIPGKCCDFFSVRICFTYITGIYLAITIDISQQMYFHILHHIAASHRDGVLPCNMVLLHHLHGVGAGRNIGEGVRCGELVAALGAAGDNGLIRRLGCTFLDKLNC